MFDKLEGLLIRFEEIMSELNEPNVANNQDRFRKLMKEQSDLTPIVEAFKEYKKSKQDIEDSLSMLKLATSIHNPVKSCEVFYYIYILKTGFFHHF